MGVSGLQSYARIHLKKGICALSEAINNYPLAVEPGDVIVDTGVRFQ